MSQVTIEFEKETFYKLLSAFQNRVRDGKVREAMAMGFELWKMNPGAFWNRAQIIAVEDCSPETIVTVNSLRAWYDGLKKDRQEDEGRMGVLKACQALAEAPKDRMADELLSLIIRFKSPRASIYYSSLLKWEDKDIVPHMSKGLRYFAEVKAHTENQRPSYTPWRELWLEMVKAEDGTLKGVE